MDKKNIIQKLQQFTQNAENRNWIELNLVGNLIIKHISNLDNEYYKFFGEFSEEGFEIEIRTEDSKILFIDLSLTFLDIRFNYFENNFFIDEIDIEDIDFYLANFFKGDYEVISFYEEKSGKVYRLEIVWKSKDMLIYNREHTYKSTKDLFVKEKKLLQKKEAGYIWRLI